MPFTVAVSQQIRHCARCGENRFKCVGYAIERRIKI
ncbi:hypothetical protein T11_3723 [Trichinella zimbabwensis]|uniref:Uncharacterized protein n=1 Tax=Trichinella zimbabwensis TaxID=268475 RepID=A0A0V1G7W3_9BILA|nr:hypothetical protein T11_3723 [Trichinella zimbabwensis]